MEIVFESVTEDPELKRKLLQEVERVVSAHCILTTNTSAIPVSLLQRDAQHPERILGVHWDDPAHVKRFLEIVPGSEKAAMAAVGTILPSDPYVDFNALTAKINDIAPQAQQLLKTLNDRAGDLQVTIARVNDLLNDSNRANLAGTLAETRGMIAENRSSVKSTVQNLSSATKKLEPLLEDLRKTSAQANEALNHVDSLIGENRADVRQAVIELRRSLATVTDLTGRLDQTLDVNSDNIDELLENLRHVSQNLKEFTNTIKTRPYTLIRSNNPREHKPGERQ